MTKAIITVDHLSKKYHLGQVGAGTFRRLINLGLSRLRSRTTLLKSEGIEARRLSNPITDQDLWALKDVSFEVAQGEVLGVIGRNGAGKSTLLKILSRITEPTSGRAVLNGRVASLLEVGTGFHPELTGRENIFLNGAILGMKKAEITAKFDEIVAFAEVERFIDTPVKRYSSGMYVRLAFAVAAFLEPEILIVDEVLAVGDASFQRKCLGRMRSVAGQGRTVLFVSHNMDAVVNLCNRAIVLHKGGARYLGEVGEAVETYLGSLGVKSVGYASLVDHPGRGPGARSRLKGVGLKPAGRQEFADHVRAGDDLVFEIEFDSCGEVLDLVQLGVCSMMGHRLFTVGTHLDQSFKAVMRGKGRVECRLPSVFLAGGEYSVTVMIGTRMPFVAVDFVENAMTFHVDAVDFFGTGRSLLSAQGYWLQKSDWRVLVCDFVAEESP